MGWRLPTLPSPCGKNPVAEKAWGGVFDQSTDRRVEQFTESVSFDRRLYAQDIEASTAHAQMLAAGGLLTTDECLQIEQTLADIRREIEQGQFPFRAELEDIHMHIERALIDRLGDAGRKLHTARSRNDQVADRPAALGPRGDRSGAGSTGGTSAGVCRPMRRRLRRDPARLYPPPAGAAGLGAALLAGLLREVRARPAPPGRLPPAGQHSQPRRRGPGRDEPADRSRGRRAAVGLRRRRRQQHRRRQRSRFRPRIRLRAGDDRRTPRRLGGRMDTLVHRRVQLPRSSPRPFAPAPRSCRRRSIRTCWS